MADTTKLYGIVDCARENYLYKLVQEQADSICLFSGKVADEIRKVSPHLVRLDRRSRLRQIWQTVGWGRGWGVLFRSRLDPDELASRLRQIHIARVPSGEIVHFRFYDPRIWRTYWPSLSPDDQENWLRFIDEFIVEPKTEIALDNPPVF